MVETEFSLVRLQDPERALAVYQGMRPLSAGDVADAIHWAVTRPPHVNVNLLELMPEDQAFSPFAVKRR
jgi:3-hydroxy acid dehydrogenase/malonic semialdehyde reductase